MNKIFKLFLVSIWLMTTATMYGAVLPGFSGGGSGTQADPYKIAVLNDLKILSGNSTYWGSGKYYIQTADIDASSTSTWNDNGAGGYYGFFPIGNANLDFRGNYDGKGYSITGLYINRPTASYVGFFGYTSSSATISNLKLVSCNIVGKDYVGALIGSSSGSISNSSSSGSVSGVNKIGGFIGQGGNCTNCNSSCAVNGSVDVGGFLGLSFTGSFTNCFSAGTVTATGSVGGFVGTTNNSDFIKCFSASNVSGNVRVGGFIGRGVDPFTFTNCYAKGIVAGEILVGGFAGYVDISTGRITNCYCSSVVNGTTNVSGFIGLSSNGTSTECYFDADIDGLAATTAGTSYNGGAGKTTAEMKMQGTFVGWDFPTTWKIDANNNGYPYLAWQVFPSPEIDLKQGSTAIVDGTSTYDFGSKITATNTDVVFTIENTGAAASTLSNFSITGTNSDQFSLQGTNPTTVANAGSATFTIRFTPTSTGSKTATVSFDNQDADENPYTFTITGTGEQLFSGGAGTQADPYKIAALADLEFLCFNSAYWAAGMYFIQTADIDATATSGWSRGDGFSPIGNFTTSFSGNYNGQNFTISGLSINRASSAVGLFGFADMNSTLSNLKLTNCNITGVNQVGTIVGLSYGTVSNISSSGSVTGSGHSIGGLIGSVSKSVSNCNSTCTVTGGTQYIGGLIGNAGCETITNCFSTSTVTGSTAMYVGGIAGVISDATVNSCYSTSNVTGSTNVGGFAGVINNMMSSVNITNSYATGTVTGTDKIGGFAGTTDFVDGTISKCYSHSIVTLGSAPELAPSKVNNPIMRLDRPTTINGFVGNYTSGTITNCYFDADVDGLVATTTGTSNNGATGKTTAEMKAQATFTGWDFPTTWTLNSTDNNGYPALAWQGFSHGNPMKLVFTTTAANQIIRLPLFGTVNCTVNWGDGTSNENVNISGTLYHSFATAGTYTVSINGSLTQFGRGYSAWPGAEYLTEVSSFGELGLTSLSGAFYAANNLTSVPAALPTIVTDLSYCFYFNTKASITNLDLWDVSHVTNMARMFSVASAFNQNIGNWNVSSVTDMSYMFYSARAFNQSIGSWNVGKVTNMNFMFGATTVFDQPIGGWDVSSVTNMSSMFNAAPAFNQPIGSWNVGNVTNISYMFFNAPKFNQNIESWNVSKVTNLSGMFNGATAFNQNIGSWNIAVVTNMTDMFSGITLSTANYDALLIGWAAQTVKPNVVFSGGNSKYTAGAAATARGTLKGGTNLWTITDGGQDIGTSVENTNNMLLLQVSPNPVRNQFSINGLAGNAEITITDMSGKVCQKTQVSLASVVSVGHLPKGMYVVQVNNENKTVRMKMIKE